LKSKASDALDRVMAEYRLNRDVLKIAGRAANAGEKRLLTSTGFYARPEEEVRGELKGMGERLDHITVLNLWVIFERYVLDHVGSQARLLSAAAPAGFATNLESKVRSEMEYWRFDDVLKLFAGWLDPDVLGQAKQIKDYRDWLAHRNESNVPPIIAQPASVRSVLGALMDAIESG
jgi:hypothetical protein